MISPILRRRNRDLCPDCGTKGKVVKPVTLRSLLKPEFVEEARKSSYRFCLTPNCRKVYFPEGQGRSFGKSDLTVRVGVKETEPPRTVCYCFDHTVEEIEEEVTETGTSQIPEAITQQCRQGLDRCEESNPKGSCCLGDVRKALKEAQAKFGKTEEVTVAAVGDRTDDVPDYCATETGFEKTAEKGSINVGSWATVGTLFAAILSSACCWLPLLLISVGVSGVAVSSTLEQYRPLFITITFAFLGAAFYFTYRPNLRALVGIRSSDPESCCAEAPQEEGCCSPESGGKRISMQKLNKAMLWVVTAFALAFVFFPNYVGVVLGGSQPVFDQPEIRKVKFRIEGMTCEGCALSVRKAIEAVPSVRGVQVSYLEEEAIVGIKDTTPISVELISNAVEEAGFQATSIGPEEDPSIVGANFNQNERR